MSKSITSNNKKQNTNFGDESGKLMKQHSEGKKTTPMSHEIHSIENALLKNTITIAYTYKTLQSKMLYASKCHARFYHSGP